MGVRLRLVTFLEGRNVTNFEKRDNQKAHARSVSHKLEIINSFKYQNYTNGPVEGTNNKIKVIQRTAYGFRNFFNFWARILLALPNSYIAINWNHKRTAHAKFQTRAA